MEQDGVERSLQIYGGEELGVANLGDEVFRAREGPTIFAGLGVDATHVNTEANVTIFLGHKQRV